MHGQARMSGAMAKTRHRHSLAIAEIPPTLCIPLERWHRPNRKPCRSVAATGGHDHARRGGDDCEITPKAPILHIVAIKIGACRIVDIVTAADLPQAGQT